MKETRQEPSGKPWPYSGHRVQAVEKQKRRGRVHHHPGRYGQSNQKRGSSTQKTAVAGASGLHHL